MENTEKQKNTWRKKARMFTPLLSLAGLMSLIIVYLFVVDFNPTPFHLQTIINQVALIAVLSTGAVFIFSLGSFDISLGVAVGVASCVGILVYNAGSGVLGMFLVCIGVGLGAGLINSTLSSVFKMPVFVMTIAMMSVLTAVMQILMDGMSTIRIEQSIMGPVRDLNNVGLRLGFMAVFFAICVTLFNYTKIGKRNKILGSNPRVAALTGISVARQTILTFLISGMGVGIASFIMIGRAQSISSDAGSSLGIDVMMSIVFGGMPLSGGAYSKIGAGLVGSVSMVLLSQILTILGASAGMSQIYRSVLFLIVVFVASFSYREKMLAKAEMF